MTDNFPISEWHFSGFTEIRAFQMNWNDKTSFNSLVNRDGSLNSTRVPIEGILLNAVQVDRLRDAVCGQHEPHPVAGCMYPHHGFLFLSTDGTVVGHLDICFMCLNKSGNPAGFTGYFDFDGLKELVQDIGLEIANPDWD